MVPNGSLTVQQAIPVAKSALRAALAEHGGNTKAPEVAAAVAAL